MPDFVPPFKTVIAGVVATVFATLLLLEMRFPLRQGKSSKARRLVINADISPIALATGAYIVAPIAIPLVARSSERPFGLLQIIPLPSAAEFVCGFLLLDLTFYYWHRAQSHISILPALS